MKMTLRSCSAGLASPRDLLQIAQHAVISLGMGQALLRPQHISAAIAAIDQAQNSLVRACTYECSQCLSSSCWRLHNGLQGSDSLMGAQSQADMHEKQP